MGFRAAFMSAVRAVSRPHLVLPAAFIAVLVLLWPSKMRPRKASGCKAPAGVPPARVRAASSPWARG